MKKTNPNGANQYLLDPRQRLCWEKYINPKSETFGNAYQSAIKSGYTKTTASQITTETWFLEKYRRLQMLSKAEKVLNETLEMKTKTKIVLGNKIVDKEDPALMKIKQDTAKFVAERLGKNDGYSTRTELTGENGESLKIVFDEAFNKKNDTAQ